MRFTPRRKGSVWSAVNIAKIAELTERGLMHPAGLRAFEQRKIDQAPAYSYEQDGVAFDAEQTARFQADAGGLGVVLGQSAVLPAGGHPLGDQRQAPGDPGAAARPAHRRFGGRHEGAAAGPPLADGLCTVERRSLVAVAVGHPIR